MDLPIYKFDNKYATDIDGFTFDFSAWLGDDDEITGTPVVTTAPEDNTLVVGEIAVSESLVTIWISAGTPGITYTIEITIETASGRNCLARGRFLVEE